MKLRGAPTLPKPKRYTKAVVRGVTGLAENCRRLTPGLSRAVGVGLNDWLVRTVHKRFGELNLGDGGRKIRDRENGPVLTIAHIHPACEMSFVPQVKRVALDAGCGIPNFQPAGHGCLDEKSTRSAVADALYLRIARRSAGVEIPKAYVAEGHDRAVWSRYGLPRPQRESQRRSNEWARQEPGSCDE